MRKILILIPILFLFNCKKRTKDLEHLICKDSIQYWNYEWKRNYPDEFGETHSFNKNGDFLNYFYIKENGLRQIYWEDIEKPYKWSISPDSLLTIENKRHEIKKVYRLIYYSNDTIKLVNVKRKDTSFLLKTQQKFDMLIKKTPRSYLIDSKTKDTTWLFSL